MNLIIEDIRRIRKLMVLEDKFTLDVDALKGDDQEPIQKGPSSNDGDDDAPDGMDESEITEDEAAAGGGEGATTSAAYPTLNKWTTGRAEGPGNSGSTTKWADVVGSKLVRSQGNKLNKSGERVWASGRNLGPTGNNYK
jgi:hypothetical protein